MTLSRADLEAIRAIVREEVAAATPAPLPLGQDEEIDVGALLPADRGGFVYFVRCMAGRHVKIGITRNLPHRMTTLRNGCPFELRLVAWYWHATPDEEERRLHASFAPSRVRGEWFAATPQLDALVDSIARLRRTAVARALGGEDVEP